MKYTLVLIFLLLAESLSGQILKVDRRSVLKDTSDYWYGNLDFRLNVNNRSATPERNFVFVGLNGNLDVNYASQEHVYMLINNIHYFTTGTGPFVSTGYAHFRANWYRKRTLSYETFSQIQYDRGRNLQRRVLSGGGIKINFFQRKKTYFHAGLGMMYESESWRDFEGMIRQVNLAKSSSYLGGVFEVNENLHINLTCYYQTGYSDAFDQFLHRLSGDFNLNLKINERLQYVTNFQLQYESRPIIRINKVFYSLTNGLKIRLG
ncbi:MAG: DUF481 domain-containing protein [Bacteroidota bacterium]